MKLRHQLHHVNPKYKKKHPDLAEDESDLDEEGLESIEKFNLDEAVLKAQKKFESANKKAKENGEDEEDEKVLKERLKEIKQEHVQIKKERKAGDMEPKGKEREYTGVCILQNDSAAALISIHSHDHSYPRENSGEHPETSRQDRCVQGGAQH